MVFMNKVPYMIYRKYLAAYYGTRLQTSDYWDPELDLKTEENFVKMGENINFLFFTAHSLRTTDLRWSEQNFDANFQNF